MYRLGKRLRQKRHRKLFWGLTVVVIIACAAVIGLVRHYFSQPPTVIKQSQVVVDNINYTGQTKHYTEPDFTVNVPMDWQFIPQSGGQYKVYAWQSGITASAPDTQGDTQIFEIYEDTIPATFAVTRALAVSSQGDHVSIDGTISNNCAAMAKNIPPAPGSTGIPVSWQGIRFLCDTGSEPPVIVGTSSATGINSVSLKSPTTGATHQFFFRYADYTHDPDYSDFESIIGSLRMR